MTKKPHGKITVNICTKQDLRILFRQTPGNDGVWGKYRFLLNDNENKHDWLLVVDDPKHNCVTELPRERRILIQSEPVTIKQYPPRYLQQFGATISSIPNRAQDELNILTHIAIPWMFGVRFEEPPVALSWDQILNQPEHPYKGEVSVVCSTKCKNIEQVRRLRFLEMLKNRLGGRLHVFGRGFNQIADKADGIAGYDYHIVLENNLLENGWTEKLADPILGGSFPIFSGAPNVADFFDSRGMRTIDISRPRRAVEEIIRILDEDPRRHALQYMEENKKRLMEKHQFFGVVTDLLDDLIRGGLPAHFDESARIPGMKLERSWKLRERRVIRAPGILRHPAVWRLYLNLFERG